jgi:hypothetical protein
VLVASPGLAVAEFTWQIIFKTNVKGKSSEKFGPSVIVHCAPKVYWPSSEGSELTIYHSVPESVSHGRVGVVTPSTENVYPVGAKPHVGV